MKKVITLVALAATMVACTNSEDIEKQVEQPSQPEQTAANMSFTATIHADTTRACVSTDGVNILWNQEDAISVFSSADGKNVKLTLNSGAGTTQGTFSGTCVKGERYLAIYPYSESTVYKVDDYNPKNSDVKYLWNGEEQIAVEGSFPLNTPMLAYAEDPTGKANNVELQFKNICTFFKVTTNYPCQSISITANGDVQYFSATQHLRIYMDTYNDHNVPILRQILYSGKTVTIKGKDGATLEPGTYYIAALPQTLTDGFTLSIVNKYGDKTFTKSTSKRVQLNRSEVLNLGAFDIATEFKKLVGEGSEENPFLIHDYDDLVTMSALINSGQYYASNFKQVRDINGEGKVLDPIGCYSDGAYHRFQGTYNGNGKTISNLLLGKKKLRIRDCKGVGDLTYCEVSALFGGVRDATIKDLTLQGVRTDPNCEELDETITNGKYYAHVKSALVGISYGEESKKTQISNVTIRSTENYNITGYANDTYVYGGIVGVSASNLEITRCTSYIDVISEVNSRSPILGGILGMAVGGEVEHGRFDFDAHITINECRNFGDYDIWWKSGWGYSYNSTPTIGGIVGVFYDHDGDNDVIPIVKNCINYGDIKVARSDESHSYELLAGIVGYMDSDGYDKDDPWIVNCINNGNITGQQYAGGIVGECYDDDTNIFFCANTGQISVTNPRSIVGYNKYGNIYGCWNLNSSVTNFIEGNKYVESYNTTDRQSVIDWMNDHISIFTSWGCDTWKAYSGSNTGLTLQYIQGPIIP